MYADSKDSLKRVLDWLAGTDEADWERQIELGDECRSDMERLARPKYSGARREAMRSGRSGTQMLAS